MEGFRIESDTMGEVKVPQDAFYGSQTERSRLNFNIATDTDKMPSLLVKSLILLKLAAAEANFELGCLDNKLMKYISLAAKKCLTDYEKWKCQFPLVIWQTGSGTQTNMNVNEVLANIANVELGSNLGSKSPIHPNDHVNMSQSSNDTFPTAMHIAAVVALKKDLIPALTLLRDALKTKQIQFEDIIKVGRTHLQDAVPMTVGQEFGSYIHQIDISIQQLSLLVNQIASSLAIGGTAVGTGLNTIVGFDETTCRRLTANIQVFMSVDQQFHPSPNKFTALAAHDELLRLSGELNTLASSILHRLAGDLRLLASGPRCGLGELILPENEPGSSIMPAKVNPTQCEAVTMVCAQVAGNHVAVTMGCVAQAQLQLNVYKPLIISNVLRSCTLLSDSVRTFTTNCIRGIQINQDKINEYIERNLMCAAALNPHIGYDNAAAVAKHAYQNNCTLKTSALNLHIAKESDLNDWLDSRKMLKPHSPILK